MPCAFVGDGINDAPTLAMPDVGTVTSNATDVALDAGGVILMSGGIAGVGWVIALSRAVMRNIKQNLFWAFGYNVTLIPIAIGVFVSFGVPQFSLILAADATVLSFIFVVTSALRLRHYDVE